MAEKKTPAKAETKLPISKAKGKRLFRTNDYIVYPAHGVGKVIGVEREEIAGFDVELYVVHFEQDKMTLRVPTIKAANSGMRALSNGLILKDAITTLNGRARIKRTMWSRRAQEYEHKIHSGDLILVAEVVRDLHRTDDQPDQSYSERQLYERAIDRMVREVAAINKVTHSIAMEDILETLAAARARSAAKAAAKAAAEAAAEAEANGEAEGDEAAA
ncbi:MAG: CarD family transcriptional regulator [Robiginitomaculum sp.]